MARRRRASTCATDCDHLDAEMDGALPRPALAEALHRGGWSSGKRGGLTIDTGMPPNGWSAVRGEHLANSTFCLPPGICLRRPIQAPERDVEGATGLSVVTAYSSCLMPLTRESSTTRLCSCVRIRASGYVGRARRRTLIPRASSRRCARGRRRGLRGRSHCGPATWCVPTATRCSTHIHGSCRPRSSRPSLARSGQGHEPPRRRT